MPCLTAEQALVPVKRTRELSTCQPLTNRYTSCLQLRVTLAVSHGDWVRAAETYTLRHGLPVVRDAKVAGACSGGIPGGPGTSQDVHRLFSVKDIPVTYEDHIPTCTERGAAQWKYRSIVSFRSH
jgi:hypothetical protein